MATKTFSDIGVLGLYAETSLHCGAEGGTGYVDLPVQRERHTLYPVIPGSTLKGVLSDELRGELQDDDHLAVFGRYIEAPEGGVASTSPGKVSFGDGILIAFPVRSSQAPLHWVTCPFALERAFRALNATVEVPEDPGPNRAWARQGGTVLLEELRLECIPHPGFFEGESAGLSRLLALFPGEARGFSYTRGLFPDRLLIVSNQYFKHLVETGTEVLTRIKLNALGTTTNLEGEQYEHLSSWDRQGNLFVEEVVPPETLFLAAIRGEGAWKAPLRKSFEGRPVIRLGGDETIGRGVTHLTFVAREP
ncbi:MAG TPA: type III-B CRISPR module RAMP protein Cmr4 [Thermoanaerobaculia bacterium]|nr:type III-B CRISPR module RAMP protein Cmr4 [Thermoanaerobaculia bacterium]